MFDWIVSLFTSGGADGIIGTISGVIGGVFTAWGNYRIKKLEYAHEEEMSRLNTQQAQMETQCNIQIEQARADAKEREAEGNALLESIKDQHTILFKRDYMDIFTQAEGWSAYLLKPVGAILAFLMGITDVASKGVRAYAPYYFGIMLFTMLNYNPHDMLARRATILLATTTFSWWFADRSAAKFMQQYLRR